MNALVRAREMLVEHLSHVLDADSVELTTAGCSVPNGKLHNGTCGATYTTSAVLLVPSTLDRLCKRCEWGTHDLAVPGLHNALLALEESLAPSSRHASLDRVLADQAVSDELRTWVAGYRHVLGPRLRSQTEPDYARLAVSYSWFKRHVEGLTPEEDLYRLLPGGRGKELWSPADLFSARAADEAIRDLVKHQFTSRQDRGFEWSALEVLADVPVRTGQSVRQALMETAEGLQSAAVARATEAFLEFHQRLWAEGPTRLVALAEREVQARGRDGLALGQSKQLNLLAIAHAGTPIFNQGWTLISTSLPRELFAAFSPWAVEVGEDTADMREALRSYAGVPTPSKIASVATALRAAAA